MTPQDFIRKWKPVALTERATAQEHFLDLCRLVGHPTPAEDDPAGDHFAFEKGAPKTGGGEGWADVWKKGFFAWEYKKKKNDLGKALEQLTRYAAALENPPLHVACDTHLFRIETRWTNEVPAKYEFELEELADPVNFARLRDVFHNPDALRSGRTREVLTREAADKFQAISDRLQHRNPGPRGGGAFRQPARLLLLRRQREAAARRPVEEAARRSPSASPSMRKTFLARSVRRHGQGRRFSISKTFWSSTAACSTAGRRWRSNSGKSASCSPPRASTGA